MTIKSLIYGLVAAVALPLVAVAAYLVAASYANDRAKALNTAAWLAGYAADEMRGLMSRTEAILSTVATRPAVRAINQQSCDASIDVLRDVDPARANITITNRAGSLVCSAVPLPGGVPIDTTDTDWFPRAISENRFVVSRLRVGRITGKLVTVLAYPVRDDGGARARHRRSGVHARERPDQALLSCYRARNLGAKNPAGRSCREGLARSDYRRGRLYPHCQARSRYHADGRL